MIKDKKKIEAKKVALDLARKLFLSEEIYVTRGMIFGKLALDKRNWRVLQHALHFLTRAGVIRRDKAFEKNYCCGSCRDKKYHVNMDKLSEFLNNEEENTLVR